MELKVRKMQKTDVNILADINIRGWWMSCSSFMDKDFLESLNPYDKACKLLSDFDKSNIIVAESENNVVGYCKYVFNSELTNFLDADGEIEKLYVEPTLSNSGIGTFLFKSIIEIFLSKNKHSLVLWCFEDAKQAKLFYQKMGGKIVYKEMRKIGNREYMDLCFMFSF
ncbi:MAG: GNAT family N-acetyltransferase [Clostridia bacterium]|nr:GNAT family N-acetyltransferase [Clostridia bacterium]